MSRINQTGVLFILGAKDPEMQQISDLLHRESYDSRCLLNSITQPVRAHEAYGMFEMPLDVVNGRKVVLVECSPSNVDELEVIGICDHHRPGDPGFGGDASEFWKHSSLGQVCAMIGVEPNEALLLTAAADHCLAKAYAGHCPGVDPERLLAHRLKQKAEFQKRPYEELCDEFFASVQAVDNLPTIRVGEYKAVDQRGFVGQLPMANEVQAYKGLNLVYSIKMEELAGIQKVGAMGESGFCQEAINKFLPGLGCIKIYGDPVRGFAGGYLTVQQ